MLLSYNVQVGGIRHVFGLQYLQLTMGFLVHDSIVKGGPPDKESHSASLHSSLRVKNLALWATLESSLLFVSSWIPDLTKGKLAWRLGMFYLVQHGDCV